MTDMTPEQALPKPEDALEYLLHRVAPAQSKDAARNIRRATESLRNALSRPAVPEGWSFAVERAIDCLSQHGTGPVDLGAMSILQDMLAAAPAEESSGDASAPEHTLDDLTDLAGQMQPRMKRIAPEILRQRAERAHGAAPESATVRYDLSPAQTESAIRDALIRMGWTPPASEFESAEGDSE